MTQDTLQWATSTTRSNRTAETEFGFYHISKWITETGTHYVATHYWQEHDDRAGFTRNRSEDVCRVKLIQAARAEIQQHYNNLVEEAKENESASS